MQLLVRRVTFGGLGGKRLLRHDWLGRLMGQARSVSYVKGGFRSR